MLKGDDEVEEVEEVRVAMNRQEPPYGCLTNGAHYPFSLHGKTWPSVVLSTPPLLAEVSR
jgi:predicted NAD-dependent protein-ADP-ribosyltransferase YbiA (DUF1768 family)